MRPYHTLSSATVNVYTTTSQYAPPYKYGALYEQLDGENTHTQPINRIIHWAKNKANDIMGDSTFGFSGMMRSNGAMIWSNTIMKHCIAIHESSGYSQTSLLSTPRSDASMANPIINKFATKTAMSEAGWPYIGTHLFGPRQFVILSHTPPMINNTMLLRKRGGPAL